MARTRVELQDIVNALLKWEGDVAAAAREVGLARNTLYKRITAKRLDLDSFRRPGIGDTPVSPMRPVSPVSPIGVRVARVRDSFRATYRRRGTRPSLAGMNAAAFPVVAEGRRRRKQPKLPPAQLDQLADAKYDFQAVVREDVDEDHILEMFFVDEFARWKDKRLEALRAEVKASGDDE